MRFFLRYSSALVLIATSLASLGAYSYFRGKNAQFIQNEVYNHSELLLHDVREIIQQHIDATQGLSAYVYSELATHHGVYELDEAQELLRGTLVAHHGELVQAAIFPPDTHIAVSYSNQDAQAPPIKWSDFPKLAPGQMMLTLALSGQGRALLRVFDSICVQKTCGHIATDIATQSIIERMLENSDKNNLSTNLHIKVNLDDERGEFPLYIHSPGQLRNGIKWSGSFDLYDTQFTVHTTSTPELIKHLTSQTAEWVLALGLILGLLLTHLTYNRARYGEQLRLKVAKRTQEISDERQKLTAVIDNATESIMALDEDGSIRRANPAACELFGYQAAEWQGLSIHDLVPKNIRDQHVQWFAEEIAGIRHDMIGKTREIRGRRKDGSIFPCEVTVAAFEAAGKRRLSVILRNLTERKHAEERLTRLSYYDELTGVPNRRLFSDRLDQAVALEDMQDQQVSVIQLCLTRFRVINETMGHAVGDEVLKQAALRINNIVNQSDMVARMGSNIFAVMLLETDAEQTMVLAEKMRLAMDIPFLAHEREITLGVNMGVAVFPDDGRNAHILMRRAASAMTLAKRMKAPIHYFSRDMEEKMERRLRMEQDLIKASSCNQLEMYYQAKYQSTDGKVCGFESLIRWRHPKQGMVSPAEFIPLAEETGLIQPITYWVLDEVSRQAVAWEKAGIRTGRLSINISAVQLVEKGLAQDILTRIKAAGASPEWFEVEITETAVMHDPETAISIMLELADAGMSLAIDDFGTGYSSLAYLKRLPAKWLKIDISFIRGLPDDEEDAAIVRSTIAMAHALGMKAIAEGVETKDQLEFLREAGCDAVQGYLFCKPLPADQAITHVQGKL